MAHGADGGPEVVLEGARLAAADGIAVRVFGPSSVSSAAAGRVGRDQEWIGNEAEPVAAVRSTPGGLRRPRRGRVAEGESAALVSAGSTGATMTAALFALKRAKGVHRPALAVQIPVPGEGGRRSSSWTAAPTPRSAPST